jgi:hypothetical protein
MVLARDAYCFCPALQLPVDKDISGQDACICLICGRALVSSRAIEVIQKRIAGVDFIAEMKKFSESCERINLPAGSLIQGFGLDPRLKRSGVTTWGYVLRNVFYNPFPLKTCGNDGLR